MTHYDNDTRFQLRDGRHVVVRVQEGYTRLFELEKDTTHGQQEERDADMAGNHPESRREKSRAIARAGAALICTDAELEDRRGGFEAPTYRLPFLPR